MYCKKCGNEIQSGARFCPSCGTEVNGDASSFGFALLSALIPIVGIVLYFVWNKEYPLKASSCLKGAIVGFSLNALMSCCFLSY